MIVNGPAILCILSAPFVFQLTRRTSQETQQVFDWFISILNFSQVLIFVFFDWFISILHLSQVLSTVVFYSVCQFHASGKGRKILFALVWAVFVAILMLSKVKSCVLLKSSELKDNFVVNLVSVWRWAEAVDFLPAKKQLRLTVMSFIFLSV